jgi:uncharacterized membrane protein
MKKNTKAAGIMKLLKQGYTAREIKNRMAVSESYIHAVKKQMAAERAAAKTAAKAFKETILSMDNTVFPDPTPKPGEFIQTSTNNVDAILNERGSRYGNFLDHARITYKLKEVARNFAEEKGKTFAHDQCEAMDMIFHKIGRILNGDPNYADSWIDIAGYAQLVADRLEGKIR